MHPSVCSTVVWHRIIFIRSVRWLDRCIKAHKNTDTQNLFAIVQGGLNAELRKKCAYGEMLNSSYTKLLPCSIFSTRFLFFLFQKWLSVTFRVLRLEVSVEEKTRPTSGAWLLSPRISFPNKNRDIWWELGKTIVVLHYCVNMGANCNLLRFF